MTEEYDKMRQALRALYIQVEEPVARDVERIVLRAWAARSREQEAKLEDLAKEIGRESRKGLDSSLRGAEECITGHALHILRRFHTLGE